MAVLESFPGGVESNDLYLSAVAVGYACLIERSHSAESHVVVLGIEDIDILVCLKILSHYLIRFGFREVTVELACDLPVRMSCGSIFQCLCSQDLRRSADGALQMKDLCLLIGRDLAFEPFDREVALAEEVGTDVRKVEIIVFYSDRSVHDDDGNIGIADLLKDRVPPFFDCGCDEYEINAFEYEAADCRELVLLLLSCVIHYEFITGIVGKGRSH